MIEAGDMVIVKEDRDEVRRLQEGHGGWHAAMAQVATLLFCWLFFLSLMSLQIICLTVYVSVCLSV